MLERPYQQAPENPKLNINQTPSQIIALAFPTDDIFNIDLFFTEYLFDVFSLFPESLKSLDNKAYYFLLLWNMKTKFASWHENAKSQKRGIF